MHIAMDFMANKASLTNFPFRCWCEIKCIFKGSIVNFLIRYCTPNIHSVKGRAGVALQFWQQNISAWQNHPHRKQKTYLCLAIICVGASSATKSTMHLTVVVCLASQTSILLASISEKPFPSRTLTLGDLIFSTRLDCSNSILYIIGS